MRKKIFKGSKRVFALVLASMLLVGVTGCGNKEAGGEVASGDPTAIAVPDPDEKYTISYHGLWCDADYEEGSYVETMIEKALNVEINVEKMENEDATNLMLSSGEMPDCAWLNKSPDFMFDQELARKIPRAMVEEYCPELIKIYDEYPALYASTLNAEDDRYFDYLSGVTFQFVDYYLPNDYYRYDWILDAGIDLGVNVEQITDNLYVADDGIELSKYIEIMDMMVNQDLDKNGKKDTIGLNAENLTQDQFFSAFGFTKGINNVDGRAEQYYALPAYKEYLKTFRDMYSKGLIDSQMVTPDRNVYWERANKEESGYWITSTNALCSWAVERPPLSLIAKKTDVKILMTPGIKQDGGTVMSSTKPSPAWGNFYVNANVDDQKLAKILQFLNYSLFGEDKDSRASLFFGEKGVDWDWNEAGDMPVKKVEMPSGTRGTFSFSQYGQTKEVSQWLYYEPMFEAGLKYWSVEDGGTWTKWMEAPYKADLRRETNFSALESEYKGDLEAYVGTYRTECILGKKDVDETWDAYLEELNRLGYKEMMDELNKVAPLQEVIDSIKVK